MNSGPTHSLFLLSLVDFFLRHRTRLYDFPIVRIIEFDCEKGFRSSVAGLYSHFLSGEIESGVGRGLGSARETELAWLFPDCDASVCDSLALSLSIMAFSSVMRFRVRSVILP